MYYFLEYLLNQKERKSVWRLSHRKKEKLRQSEGMHVAIMTVCADAENDKEEVQRQLKSVIFFTFLVPWGFDVQKLE